MLTYCRVSPHILSLLCDIHFLTHFSFRQEGKQCLLLTGGCAAATEAREATLKKQQQSQNYINSPTSSFGAY